MTAPAASTITTVTEFLKLNYNNRLSFLGMSDYPQPSVHTFILNDVKDLSTNEIVDTGVSTAFLFNKYGIDHVGYEVIEWDYVPAFQKAKEDHALEQSRRLSVFKDYLKARYLKEHEFAYHDAIYKEAEVFTKDDSCNQLIRSFNFFSNVEEHYENVIDMMRRILSSVTENISG